MDGLQQFDEPMKRLSKDIKESAKLMSKEQIRYLVDFYYQIQDFRIQAAAQMRSMDEQADNPEPVNVIEWVFYCQKRIESSIKSALDYYTDKESSGMGKWAKGIIGIGPVISSGLLAHIDIDKAATVGHIWRFAGLDPTSKWEKKSKRPWNAKLKVLCWKAGESFIKFQNNPNDTYGKLYVQRKAFEQVHNEAGDFADQAKAVLESKKVRKETEAYKWYSQGKLPPAHIHARARRWAVKIFLYHWFAEAYQRRWNKEPPKPYVIEHLGHADLI
jgi:hypothetical protein